MNNEIKETLLEVRSFLNNQKELGVYHFPIEEALEEQEIMPKTNKTNKTGSLASLKKSMGNCKKCKLHPERTNLVFGAGSAHADLMFIGEGPGRDEDLQGLPFVGRSGKLLTKIIEAMGITRDDVYIANIVKCRPPKNRNPEKDEIETCSQFLLKQIDSIKPKIIVCLGTFSAQTLLQTDEKISNLRGKIFDYHGVKLLPTFHPAFLLRNPSMKKIVWEDMQIVMDELGLKK